MKMKDKLIYSFMITALSSYAVALILGASLVNFPSNLEKKK
jgi:hypothetical protein